MASRCASSRTDLSFLCAASRSLPLPPQKKIKKCICCPRKALIGLKIGLDGAFGNCTTTSPFHCVVEVVGLASASVNFLSSFQVRHPP